MRVIFERSLLADAGGNKGIAAGDGLLFIGGDGQLLINDRAAALFKRASCRVRARLSGRSLSVFAK